MHSIAFPQKEEKKVKTKTIRKFKFSSFCPQNVFVSHSSRLSSFASHQHSQDDPPPFSWTRTPPPSPPAPPSPGRRSQSKCDIFELNSFSFQNCLAHEWLFYRLFCRPCHQQLRKLLATIAKIRLDIFNLWYDCFYCYYSISIKYDRVIKQLNINNICYICNISYTYCTYIRFRKLHSQSYLNFSSCVYLCCTLKLF